MTKIFNQLKKRLIPFFTLVEKEVVRNKRVLGQAILAPLVTASLYIFVFGYVLGSNIKSIAGVPYIEFVFPGVFAMNLIIAVFSASSFTAYMLKFQKIIEDLLTLPISYAEVVLSILTSAVFRGLALSLALSVVAVAFGVSSLAHPVVLVMYILLVAFLFGLLGIVVGIWADNSFEKLGIATNFILTPLSFLGGAFYSTNMLPETMKFILKFNPVFYAVDGIRYSLTGYHEVPILLGVSVLLGLASVALAFTVYIFRTGWKLRS